MEIVNNLNINQTLHGYAEGHSLLASSVDLSASERKYLIMMSDLAGSGVEIFFPEYLTAYPIPGGRYYALAKTWYASEMARPGCVWTHTLLIDQAKLGDIGILENLCTFFVRPIVDQYSAYNKPLQFFNAKQQLKLTNTIKDQFHKQLSFYIYGKPNKSIIFPLSNQTEFEREIFRVWQLQWPNLRRNFSFCSGTTSLREIDNNQLNVQVIPNERITNIVRKLSTNSIVVGEESVEPVYEKWLDYYFSCDKLRLFRFMCDFGADIEGERTNFVPLVEAFRFFESKQLNDDETFQMIRIIEDNFKKKSQAKKLKNEVIRTIIEKDIFILRNLLEKYLDNKTNSSFFSNYSLVALLGALIDSKRLNDDEIVAMLVKSLPRLTDTDLISLVRRLSFESWINSELVFHPALEDLLRETTIAQKSLIFWNGDAKLQKKWFDIASESPNTNWVDLIPTMIAAKNDQFVDEIFDRAGEDAIKAALNYVNATGISLPKRWENLVYSNLEYFFLWLSREQQISSYVTYLIQSIPPDDRRLKKINRELWKDIILNYRLDDHISITTFPLAAFISTASLLNNLHSSEFILEVLFQSLHDAIKRNIVEVNSWQIFNLFIARTFRNVYSIEQSFWLFSSTSHHVPEWDKCEIFRRSFVSAFIKYDWREEHFLNSINDLSTLEKIVDYCIKFYSGQQFLLKITQFISKRKLVQYHKQLDVILSRYDQKMKY